MRRYLQHASPEAWFLFSAIIGVAIAWAATLIPGLGFRFIQILVILLSIDVATYIAMKAGWIRTPRQRSGVDS